MYGIVANNINSTQKGVNFSKCAIKYCLEHGGSDFFINWSERDIGTILLDGGTTNFRRFDGKYIGSINRHLEEINRIGIKNSTYCDKNLGDQLTAIVFLVDERVWNFKKYPDYEGPWSDDGKTPFDIPYKHWLSKFGEDSDKVFSMRNFLKKFTEI
jgi:hypothetical protein